MKITEIPSPNFNERKDGKKPYILMLHYTDSKSTQHAIDLLCDPAREVSAHYVVGDNTEVVRMVPEEARAWHAGKGYWAGETDVNSVSIGIEIQNTGHTFGYTPFPEVQMRTVLELCRDILQRHDIKPWNVLAHSDTAPGRKQDPGHLFPWQWLAEEGVGLWRKETAKTDGDLIALLQAYGYDPNVDPKELITAFQRHYEPEVFIGEDRSGQSTENTLGIIHSLLAQKSASV
jgi:N-acetylmuramoyl-L-alanine amidase